MPRSKGECTRVGRTEVGTTDWVPKRGLQMDP